MGSNSRIRALLLSIVEIFKNGKAKFKMMWKIMEFLKLLSYFSRLMNKNSMVNLKDSLPIKFKHRAKLYEEKL